MEPEPHNDHEHAVQHNEAEVPGAVPRHDDTDTASESVQPGSAYGEGSHSPRVFTHVERADPDAAVAVPAVLPASSLGNGADPVNPVAVVRVLSPMGVEYVFMTVSLFAAAGGLAAALIAIVNGKTDFEVLAFPTALLLVSVPIFALLFLRTKKQELLRPMLRHDPSKRRSTQFTQILCFLISMFTLVGLVSSVFAKLGGTSSISIGKVALDCLVLLVVFGGMLAYYWQDEHSGR